MRFRPKLASDHFGHHLGSFSLSIMPAKINAEKQAAKRAKQEQKTAEASADAMANSFTNLADLALHKELDFLTEHMRGNPTLVYTLSSCIRDGTLEGLITGQYQDSAGKKAVPKSKAKDRLRENKQKRWKHLSEVQMQQIVLAARPDYAENELPASSSWTEVGYALLGVCGDDPLPHHKYPQCIVFNELKNVAAKRYVQLGSRFGGIPLSDLYGFFKVQGDKLQCSLMPSDQLVHIPMAADATVIEVVDPWNQNSELLVKTPQAVGKFLIQELIGNIFTFPEFGEEWNIPNYDATDPMDESDNEDGASSAASSRSRSKPSPRFLSDALRARLAGSGSASSSSAVRPP